MCKSDYRLTSNLSRSIPLYYVKIIEAGFRLRNYQKIIPLYYQKLLRRDSARGIEAGSRIRGIICHSIYNLTLNEYIFQQVNISHLLMDTSSAWYAAVKRKDT
jgi:hypothetical protein